MFSENKASASSNTVKTMHPGLIDLLWALLSRVRTQIRQALVLSRTIKDKLVLSMIIKKDKLETAPVLVNHIIHVNKSGFTLSSKWRGRWGILASS